MSNRVSHLHAFRLTDEDEEKLRTLLQRFHIATTAEKSSSMRYLIRAVYGLLMEMDAQPRGALSGAAQPGIRDLSAPGARASPGISDEDGEEQLDEYMEDARENPDHDADYSRLRGEAMEVLRNRCLSFTSENVLAVIAELRLAEHGKSKGSELP